MRRYLSTIIVVMLALWGMGLPRFAHVMTAHVPQGHSAFAVAETSGASARCTSRCCALPVATSEPQAAVEGGDDSDEGCATGCNHESNCSICDLLATLATSVPAVPTASAVWEPVPQLIVEAMPVIVPASGFDPHAPRGPPARA